MDEDDTDFETADQACAREDAQFMATGPLPDEEPEHDEDVGGAIAEVRRAEDMMRTCHFCGTSVVGWCGSCEASWGRRPEAATMTKEARVAEPRSLVGPLEVPFALVHERIEALVGRPVFTHELAGRRMVDMLAAEIMGGPAATLEEIVDKAVALKGAVVVLT